MDDEAKTDLLQILSCAFERKNLDGIVFLDIQKIFYYLRERLNDSNDIADSLQYYWYEDGCMSDTVKEAVDYGVEENILTATSTQRTQNGNWYQFNEENDISTANHRDDLQEAIETVEIVLSEDYDVFRGYEPKIKDLYEEAPLPFQQYFKTKLLWYVEDVEKNNIQHRDADKISSMIALGESYLPLDRQYSDFNDVYSKYMNISQKYLEHSNGEHSGLFVVFSSLSKDMWELFSKKLRICEHDPYYDDKVEQWEDDYAEKQKQVMSLLLDFDRMVNAEFNDEEESVDPVSESNGWSVVADAYLSDVKAELD